MNMTPTLPYAPPRLSVGGIGLVLALHAAALWALLRMEMLVLPAPLAVLQVSLLTPPTAVAPQPNVAPPRPRPLEKRPPASILPPHEAPLLAAPADASSPVATPSAEKAAVPPAPTFAPDTLAALPTPTQPRFDAAYLDNPKPAYPALSRRIGEEGRVVLRVQVAASGLPTDVALHTPSGFERLDRAALDTVRRWKFVPARRGDEAVAASVLVPIVFSLKD
jgi:protein TonB